VRLLHSRVGGLVGAQPRRRAKDKVPGLGAPARAPAGSASLRVRHRRLRRRAPLGAPPGARFSAGNRLVPRVRGFGRAPREERALSGSARKQEVSGVSGGGGGGCAGPRPPPPPHGGARRPETLLDADSNFSLVMRSDFIPSPKRADRSAGCAAVGSCRPSPGRTLRRPTTEPVIRTHP
jgi:hypothetical protein